MNRKIDEAGRIVIPKEIRKYLNIKTDDELNIEISNNSIILTKSTNIVDELKKELEGWENLDLDNLLVAVRNIDNKLKQLKEGK